MTRDEFWQVVQLVRPDVTRAEFLRMWREFQRLKAWRML